MRARHEAIWNDRPTSRCKAGCVAVIGSGIRSTFYAQLRRRRAFDRVSIGGYEIKPAGCVRRAGPVGTRYTLGSSAARELRKISCEADGQAHRAFACLSTPLRQAPCRAVQRNCMSRTIDPAVIAFEPLVPREHGSAFRRFKDKGHAKRPSCSVDVQLTKNNIKNVRLKRIEEVKHRSGRVIKIFGRL